MYISILLPDAFNGCKTSSSISKGRIYMEVFENVLRTPSGPKAEKEKKGGWTKVHENVKFFTKCKCYDQIKEDEWDNQCKQNVNKKI
jgi:hypothetical protein